MVAQIITPECTMKSILTASHTQNMLAMKKVISKRLL